MYMLRCTLIVTALLLLCSAVRAQGSADYCNELAADVLNDNNLLTRNVINVVNAPSCFIQANENNPDAVKQIAPARVSLWNAFEALSGSQQQGSSLPSSASTNTVSKPSGPTALIEEFGGANATSGTSSLTVQWSPGTMFTNLAVTGAVPLCLDKDFPKGCVSPGLLKGLAPLTFKITANTSSGTPSIAGSVASPSPGGTAQQVKVESNGASAPGFAGLTVQYSLFGSKTKAAAASLTSQTSSISPGSVNYYAKELSAANTVGNMLANCAAYTNWKQPAANAFRSVIAQSESNREAWVQALQTEIEKQYRGLLSDMLKSPTCQSSVQSLSALFAAILEAETYEDFVAQQNASKTPEVALEYDLNTPKDQPSYSSVKATLTRSFRIGPQNKKQGPADEQQEKQRNVRSYAEEQATAVSASTPTSSSSIQQATANAKPQAHQNIAPWSLAVTGTGDFYNAEPNRAVPSSSHLRDLQLGAEVAYDFAPSSKSGALRTFIGDITAAAAYSYQDQTSPAILTGPALTDFTGLPSSTTAAYAQRGAIHVGQIRLGFGAGTNLTFPIAFTYSNRTELIVHPTWGLQFGLSYNLTALLSSSGSSKK